jgi:hypothetical protein
VGVRLSNFDDGVRRNRLANVERAGAGVGRGGARNGEQAGDEQGEGKKPNWAHAATLYEQWGGLAEEHGLDAQRPFAVVRDVE